MMACPTCDRTFPNQGALTTHRKAHSWPVNFWAKVNKTETCWLWTSWTDFGGYGSFRYGGRRGTTHKAHRVAYELVKGPIPHGLDLDHLCRVRLCVNPDHLEPVTRSENLRRSPRFAVSTCPAGHPYDETNTRLYPRSGKHHGGRQCATCHHERRIAA